MHRFTALAAALLTVAPSVAHAAETQCLTPGEFTALAEYALPSMITGASQRCATTLGPSAYLPREGAQLAQRYSQRRTGAWPGAKAAFMKLSTTSNNDANAVIKTLPDTSMQQMLTALMEGIVAQQIPLDRCTTIDRAIGLLAPLPAQNTAELIALAVGLGAKSGKAKVGSLSLCES